MKLSRYVLKIPYGLKMILYNTTNDMMVVCSLKDFFNKSVRKTLKKNDFFEENDKLLKRYLNGLKLKRKGLDITISLTEACNLKCKYCSQSLVRNNSYITKEIIDEIIKYIDICIKNYGYKSVSIHLFGGEPLLQKEQIEYLNSKLKKYKIPVYYYMDTNGVLLDSIFIKQFDDITFCVTLSLKEDHDSLRVMNNNKGSYDIILKNLYDIQDSLDKNHRLMIRYNVNDRNINDLEDFLISIRELKVSNIEIAYTNNYENNIKTNNLSYKKYKKWNTKKVIPLLVKYGYEVPLPVSSYYCKGYEKYSIKVFSNGKVGMCNAYDMDKFTVYLRDILNEYRVTKCLKEVFKEERNLNKIVNNECRKCKYLYLCNGKYYCKDNPCEFTDYDIKKYIKEYVKYFN